MTEPTILGRQPVTLYITPSKPNAWYGTIIGGVKGKHAVTGGERFTVQQMAELRKRGLDPDNVEAITVTRNATSREMWWPIGGVAPQFQFECPVIGRRGGRVTIIAPGGWPETVAADGWAGQTREGK